MAPHPIDTGKLHAGKLVEELKTLRMLASLKKPAPNRVGALRWKLIQELQLLSRKIHDTCDALLARADEHEDSSAAPSKPTPRQPEPRQYPHGTDAWDAQRKTIPWCPQNMEDLQAQLATTTPIGIAPLQFHPDVLEKAMNIQRTAQLDTRCSIAVLCALIEARRDGRKVTAEALAEQLSYNIGSVSGVLFRLRSKGLEAINDVFAACSD